MNFASDNGAGVAPEILDAIVASSRVNAPAYGADDFTARAQARLSEVFETKVVAFLVATGTAANALALSALAKPWDAVFCRVAEQKLGPATWDQVKAMPNANNPDLVMRRLPAEAQAMARELAGWPRAIN